MTCIDATRLPSLPFVPPTHRHSDEFRPHSATLSLPPHHCWWSLCVLVVLPGWCWALCFFSLCQLNTCTRPAVPAPWRPRLCGAVLDSRQRLPQPIHPRLPILSTPRVGGVSHASPVIRLPSLLLQSCVWHRCLMGIAGVSSSRHAVAVSALMLPPEHSHRERSCITAAFTLTSSNCQRPSRPLASEPTDAQLPPLPSPQPTQPLSNTGLLHKQTPHCWI